MSGAGYCRGYEEWWNADKRSKWPIQRGKRHSTLSIAGPLECASVLLDLPIYPEKPEFQNFVWKFPIFN